MSYQDSRWWKAVEIIAVLNCDGFDDIELSDDMVVKELSDRGFDRSDIDKAHEWIENVAMGGHLAEVMAMLQPQHENGMRVANPLETACLSKNLLDRMEFCRQRGMLSSELIERLLEGVRMLDTRDWDDEEVAALLAELLSSILPATSEQEFLDILGGRTPAFYS